MSPAKKAATPEQLPTQSKVPAPYEADAYIQLAKENGSAGKFTSEVAALKIFEALGFFSRMGLDRTEAATLATKAVDLELKMMEIHVAARKVVLEEEGGESEPAS